MVDTPNDIRYETPRDDAVSPHDPISPRRPKNHNEAGHIVVESEDSTSEAEDGAQIMLFDRNGDSLFDMTAMFRAAQSHASNANLEKAELLFLKALKGYGVLLGPTHEDATKVAIAVANFYTKQGQFNDADMVVQDLCQHHIEKFGIKHPLTQQVIQQAADLLNGCNRPNNALDFLSRIKELAEPDTEEAFRGPNKRSKTRQQDSITRRTAATPSSKVLDVTEEITAASNPDQFEHRIQVARTHVGAKDEVLESFLKAINDHCENHGEALEVQILRAKCELSKFYSKFGQDDSHNTIISKAISTAEAIICRQKWVKENLKKFETMEGPWELVASALEGWC